MCNAGNTALAVPRARSMFWLGLWRGSAMPAEWRSEDNDLHQDDGGNRPLSHRGQNKERCSGREERARMGDRLAEGTIQRVVYGLGRPTRRPIPAGICGRCRSVS